MFIQKKENAFTIIETTQNTIKTIQKSQMLQKTEKSESGKQ